MRKDAEEAFDMTAPAPGGELTAHGHQRSYGHGTADTLFSSEQCSAHVGAFVISTNKGPTCDVTSSTMYIPTRLFRVSMARTLIADLQVSSHDQHGACVLTVFKTSCHRYVPQVFPGSDGGDHVGGKIQDENFWQILLMVICACSTVYT